MIICETSCLNTGCGSVYWEEIFWSVVEIVEGEFNRENLIPVIVRNEKCWNICIQGINGVNETTNIGHSKKLKTISIAYVQRFQKLNLCIITKLMFSLS